MLEEVTIHDLGVVKRATVPLGPGFTAVTGETGAGKTMVVTALQLLAGGRSDASRVRTGADRARVEARVRVPVRGTVSAQVAELGGETEPLSATEAEVILSRTVAASGRSRAWVGGATVPVRALADLGAQLVTVHGQSDQLRLRSPAAQREALDSYAGPEAAELLSRCRAEWEAAVQARDRVDRIVRADADRAEQEQRDRRELAELERIAPDPSEYDALTRTVAALQHREEIAEALAEASRLLNGDEHGSGARDQLEGARAAVEGLRAYGSEFAALADQLAELGFGMEDVVTALGGARESQEPVGPEALEQAADRLAALDGLRRRYGDLSAAVARMRELRDEIDDLASSDERLAEARDAAREAAARLQTTCAALHRLRLEAGTRLETALEAELASLAMPTAHLQVRVTESEPSGNGGDVVEFLLSPHPGASAAPLAKAASGGELSRIMLALELNLAVRAPELCFVFDEVDSGVGGAVALEIGRRLQRLGTRVQVVAVTHLPQVAAFADRQISVVKRTDADVTASDVRVLDSVERVHEIARMLSGLADSETALAHARELLQTAAPGAPTRGD